MKCDTCKGTGVIDNTIAGYTPTSKCPCPMCDHGNLQLRLDHNFQPVVDDGADVDRMDLFEQARASQLRQQIEACGREPNPIYQDLPFMPVGGSLQNQDWTPGRFNSVPVSKVTPLKMEPPTAVQDRDAAIAQVHAEFAKAGLRIVPVEDIKQAVRAIEDLRDDIKHEFGVNSATRCDKTIQALCALLPKE